MAREIAYVSLNPTATVHAQVFTAVVTIASGAVAVAPRAASLGLLAFAATSCWASESSTLSWFGFVLLGVAALALVALVLTMIIARSERRRFCLSSYREPLGADVLSTRLMACGHGPASGYWMSR